MTARAMAVDPLSGSGILRALVSGEAAGLATAHWLLDRHKPAHDYERWLDTCFSEYQRQRRLCYGLETRWRTGPFWRRRLPTPEGPTPPASYSPDRKDARSGTRLSAQRSERLTSPLTIARDLGKRRSAQR